MSLSLHCIEKRVYQCFTFCIQLSTLLIPVFSSKPRTNVARPVTKRTQAEEVMHLAVVACGNRLDETLTMVKSALLFSLKRIKFHIFAEDPLAPQFVERVRNRGPECVLCRFLQKGTESGVAPQKHSFLFIFCVEDPRIFDLM